MATLAGTQKDIGKMLEALVELEYDAIAAYSVAIDKLQSATSKTTFEGFRADHLRHVRDLGSSMRTLGREPPETGDVKAVLTKGKVYLGSLAEDKGILMAMRSNENDTNSAYEHALEHDDLTLDLEAVMQQCLADERRHRRWIEDQLSLLKEKSSASHHRV